MSVEKIEIQTVWGDGKVLVAGDHVSCDLPSGNGGIFKDCCVEVVALPVNIIENPELFVPVLRIWEDPLPVDEARTKEVYIIPIENVKGAHLRTPCC